MSRLWSLVVWLIFLCAAPCAAEIQVSLPLEGYYRPGRYMPVRVIVNGQVPGAVGLAADGAVPTTLQLDGRAVDVIVPLLVVRGPLGPVTWSLTDGRKGTVETKPVPLGEDDRLVGLAGGNAGIAPALFLGKTIIYLPLDPADPLGAQPSAWETLDAVIVDREPVPYVSSALAMRGTAIVVRSAARPDAGNALPWRGLGDAWVISHEPIGPRGVIAPEAYSPTYGWKPGRRAATRRQVVLIAVLFSIVTVAATLWRSRAAILGIIAVSAAACGALAFRASRQSPVTVARGIVEVRRGYAIQSDKWEFYKSMAPVTAYAPPKPMARPVFASVGHFEQSGIRLVCGDNGEPRWFTFPLTGQTSMAFLTRRARLRSEEHPDPSATTSPLWPLVREGYLRPGVRAAGEVGEFAEDVGPIPTDDWRGIALDDLRP